MRGYQARCVLTLILTAITKTFKLPLTKGRKACNISDSEFVAVRRPSVRVISHSPKMVLPDREEAVDSS